MLRAIKKQNRAGLTVSFVTYPLPTRNAFICINVLFSVCCIEFPHNKYLDLTFKKPQSSGYYATQYFQSPFLREKAVRKSGQVPVMSRITINGTMSQFSCKLTVRSSLWNAKANKASGKSLESQCVNEKLENIKTNIHK